MVYHMRAIAENLDDPVFLILDFQPAMDVMSVFGEDPAEFIGFEFEVIKPTDLAERDGTLAAVVCPNPIAGMEYLQETRSIGLQYSMAKDRYVNGPWRAMFDMTMTYGRYSAERIAQFCPTRMVGNPRFDRWFSDAGSKSLARPEIALDDSRPTILYLPTWGEFSSIDLFLEEVLSLSSSYNVLIKVHHKTDTHEAHRKEALARQQTVHYFGAMDDLLPLLNAADLVLSDYSGAIFDAIYVRKPVVLLQSDPKSVLGKKFGYESIEYARRDDIGFVVSSPKRLANAVTEVMAGSIDFKSRNEMLRSEIFEYDRGTGEIAATAITTFLSENPERPLHQVYLRDELKSARLQKRKQQETIRMLKHELRTLRKRNKPRSETAKLGNSSPVFAHAGAVKHYHAGLAYEHSGQWSSAAAEYRSALRYDGTHAELHARLGYVLEQAGEWMQASTAFEAALRNLTVFS